MIDTEPMKSIAIIGASNDPSKYGNKAVRLYRDLEFTVYPVNPKESVIEGMTAYKSILDVPERPDMVSVYLPPAVLLGVLPQIAKRGCSELWLNPGTESPELIAQTARVDLNTIQASTLLAAQGQMS